MSDRRLNVYRLGADANIPNGLIKRFRNNIAEFKPYWYNVYRLYLRGRLQEREREREREGSPE